MAHVYKVTEWDSPSGKYYCNDVTDLAHGSGKWWIPCRILGISPADFVLLLINEYKAEIDFYNEEKDLLCYSWRNKTDCHKYALYINRIARNKNFIVRGFNE
jgi:hypothetical protein